MRPTRAFIVAPWSQWWWSAEMEWWRKGIRYDAWRAAGVEARVLKSAGIGRGQ